MIFDLTQPGGAYLRVSDDGQDISTQRVTIHGFETRHGVTIPAANWHEDKDWSRDEYETRPGWLAILEKAKTGAIKWIVIAAKDRAGTADGPEKVAVFKRLRQAGCALVLASTGQILNAGDVGSNVAALIDGHQEENEVRIKSERALEKMRQHHAAGRWMGGSIPFGLDVVCIDKQGREQWRVEIDGPDMRVKIAPDGTRTRYDGRDNFPGRDSEQGLTLRPSLDAARRAIVREAFDALAVEALSTYQIAARFNDQHQPHPAGKWMHWHIETMLRNAAYLGVPTWNKTSKSKWSEHVGGVTVPHAERNTKIRKHAPADWIRPTKPQFDAIVDPTRFEDVQGKLGGRTAGKRSPKSASLYLSGLLYCSHCGRRMAGTVRNGVATYVCGSYLERCNGIKSPAVSADKPAKWKYEKQRGTCPYRVVKHDEAEAWLKGYFEETAALMPKRAKTPPAKVAATMQAAWIDAMGRLAAAQQTMRDRVVEWARHADPKIVEAVSHRPTLIALDANERPIVSADGQNVTVDGEPRISVTDAYRAIFAGERDQAQSRLDQIDTEHTQLSLAWQTLPTPRAKAKAEARLKELEEEIADLEKRVADAAASFEQSRTELDALLVGWEAATVALTTDGDDRRKAAAIRRVVDRINVTFAPTGRERPSWYVAEAQIVPVGAGEATTVVGDVVSVARVDTANSADTRAFACDTGRSRSRRRTPSDG